MKKEKAERRPIPFFSFIVCKDIMQKLVRGGLWNSSYVLTSNKKTKSFVSGMSLVRIFVMRLVRIFLDAKFETTKGKHGATVAWVKA